MTFFFKHAYQLIEAGYIYIGQPPLYRIKEGKKDIFIKNRDEYNNYIDNRIIKLFNIYYKDTKQNKTLQKTDREIKTFLKHTRFYLEDLQDMSSEYFVDPKLMEFFIINSRKKSFKELVSKNFNELNIISNKDGSSYKITGIYNNNYVSIIINRKFKEKTSNLFNLIKDNNLFNLGLKKVSDENEPIKKCSLYTLLNTVYKAAEPKYKQRFKGLGESSAEQLNETTINVNSRKLVKVNIEDYEKAVKEFEIQMGKDSIKRKKFLSEIEVDPEELGD